MATKTFNTRIQQKIDTYANWQSANPVLLKGELAIVIIPADAKLGMNEPSTMFKVGDGTSTFKTLPWTSSLAGDVSAWAKAANKPSYSASEISGIDNYINTYISDTMGISVDTNTVYRIVSANDGKGFKLQSKAAAEAETSWADVTNSSIDFSNKFVKSISTGSANGTISVDGTNVSVKGLNTAAYTTTAALESTMDTKVNAAKTAINNTIGTVTSGKTVVGMINDSKYNDTSLKNRVSALESTSTTLVGSDSGKSIRTIANEELAAQLIPSIAKESLDTLAEIAAWIQAHPDDVASINSKISALETKMGNTSVSSQITSAISNLDLANTYDAKGAAATAKSEAISAAKTAADSAYVAKVSGKGLSTNDYTAIEKTKLSGIATGAQANVIESVKVNGTALTVTSKAVDVTVPTKISDLGQDSGDYLIFNCGTSTTNI